MKYEIEYDFTTLATVEIDEEEAAPIIREMVEFWMGWEEAVENEDGDYTSVWLKTSPCSSSATATRPTATMKAGRLWMARTGSPSKRVTCGILIAAGSRSRRSYLCKNQPEMNIPQPQ